MKKLVFAVLFLLTIPLWAETVGDWAGYVTYAPEPIATKVAFPDADLAWLKDTARLLGPDGFTFLGRRDDTHWMGLTDKVGSWVLQIRDETTRFHFRAVISPKTGRMTVEKGVQWVGSSPAANAAQAAGWAVGYVHRARLAQDLFGIPPSMAPAPTAPAVKKGPAPMPAPAPMKDKPTTEKPMAEKPKVKESVPEKPMVKEPMAEKPKSETSMMAPDPMLGSGGGDAWQRLVDGNLRFVSGKVTHPNQSMARVEATAKGQHPFAVVVGCSDSRVPPEVLFDQGVGDLFVIRTAGEVVTEVELGSIEYAIEHLGAAYLVVLGHKRCGAVEATLKGGDLPANIEAVAAQIRPAVEAARFIKGDLLDNAVRENIKLVEAKIQGVPSLAEAMRSGKLNIKAAYYDTDTAKVAALP